MYFETCYIDLSGPENAGDNRFLHDWNPDKWGNLAPGVLERIEQIIHKLKVEPATARSAFLREDRTRPRGHEAASPARPHLGRNRHRVPPARRGRRTTTPGSLTDTRRFAKRQAKPLPSGHSLITLFALDGNCRPDGGNCRANWKSPQYNAIHFN